MIRTDALRDTADLEDGRSYNRDRTLVFARRWRS